MHLIPLGTPCAGKTAHAVFAQPTFEFPPRILKAHRSASVKALIQLDLDENEIKGVDSLRLIDVTGKMHASRAWA